METKKILHMVAFTLLVVGGLNWGIFALFELDLVEYLFGVSPTLVEAIYLLVGVSAVYLVVTHAKDCKVCATPSK